MKTKVNGAEVSRVMLVVTTTIVLLITALPLTSYIPSTFSAEATNSGHGDDKSQTSKDLGKEEKQKEKSYRGDEKSQTSKDLGKEEKQDEGEEESPQVAGQDSPDNEDSGEIIEGNTDVDQELLDELRGGQTIKEGGIDEGEESEGETDVNQELLDELRGGQTSK
jgi:hypothetical protein